jgi:CubicO group peptidase (beta-lactamase class C family)
MPFRGHGDKINKNPMTGNFKSKTAFCLLGIIWALSGMSCTEKAEVHYYPENGWRTASPEMVGIDPENLARALEYLESECSDDGVKEVVIIKDGYLVYRGENADKRHGVWSVTKSFTSTVLGLLIDEGKCSPDNRAAVYLPALSELYPDVRLKHFATMTSGYSAQGQSRWGFSNDWSITPYIPCEPLFVPGSAYAYWDEAQMTFGAVLTRIAGQDMKEYLDEKVMRHINFGEWGWGTEPLDQEFIYRNGCTGVEVSAMQLARFGYLFLRKGKWNDSQLIPPEWVEQALQNQVPAGILLADTERRSADGRGNYGYNWWTNGYKANGELALPDMPMCTAYMSGANNNMCFVIPAWDMVMVRMGLDGNPPKGKTRVYNEFFRILSGEGGL